MNTTKKIGILTGGADCPGLNAVIRSVVVKANQLGYEVIGFKRGWHGLTNEGEFILLNIDDVEDIQMLGGTIIRTSRFNPLEIPGCEEIIEKNIKKHDIEGLIVVGGQKTLSIGQKFFEKGMPVVGVPKTIDNNVRSTDFSFGFDSAVNTATEAIDRLHTTARSHERILVVEVMGANAGWMALHAGLAGGAHLVLIPEVPFEVSAVCDLVTKRKKEGKEYSLIVIAEGAVPSDYNAGNVPYAVNGRIKEVKSGTGVGDWLAAVIHNNTKIETRSVVLGHIQRGGAPSAFDRIIGTRMGIKSVEMIYEKKFGMMAALHGVDIMPIPITDAIATPKKVNLQLYEESKPFFG